MRAHFQPQSAEGILCLCNVLTSQTHGAFLLRVALPQTPWDALCIPRSQTKLVAMEIHTLQLFFSLRLSQISSQQSICHFLTTQTNLTQDAQNVINWQFKMSEQMLTYNTVLGEAVLCAVKQAADSGNDG